MKNKNIETLAERIHKEIASPKAIMFSCLTCGFYHLYKVIKYTNGYSLEKSK